ncbi:MAG TPA: hypothetical protein VIK89_12885 [Cytophagaceae bacterium]
MKKSVVLISNDLDLHKRLEDTGLFDQVTIDTSISSVGVPDILIVSDKIIHYNELIELFDSKLNHIPHVFYMISNNSTGANKNIMQVLKVKGVKCIPPRMTITQILERICAEVGLTDISNKNIAVFLGTDSKVGTTMVTQCIAETIAKYSKARVALLFLNGQPSTDYIQDRDNVLGLDSIKVKVINKILSDSELIGAFIKLSDNLYALPGAKSILDVRYFSNDHIENLIQLTSKLFDVVLVDAGHKIFNGMTIGSVNSTPHKYLITTQQDSALRNFERTCSQVFSELDIDPKDFLLIVNKFVHLPELYTSSQLANLYKTSLIGTIDFVDYGWQAEKDQKSLLNYDITSLNKQILELSKIIASQMGVELTITKEVKPGIFSRIFR